MELHGGRQTQFCLILERFPDAQVEFQNLLVCVAGLVGLADGHLICRQTQQGDGQLLPRHVHSDLRRGQGSGKSAPRILAVHPLADLDPPGQTLQISDQLVGFPNHLRRFGREAGELAWRRRAHERLLRRRRDRLHHPLEPIDRLEAVRQTRLLGFPAAFREKAAAGLQLPQLEQRARFERAGVHPGAGLAQLTGQLAGDPQVGNGGRGCAQLHQGVTQSGPRPCFETPVPDLPRRPPGLAEGSDRGRRRGAGKPLDDFADLVLPTVTFLGEHFSSLQP